MMTQDKLKIGNKENTATLLNKRGQRKQLLFEASFVEQAPDDIWEDLNDYLMTINFFNT